MRTANFTKNYKNYETCENSQDLRGTQRELRKQQIFAKVPRTAHEMSEGPNENCEFDKNYENCENCNNSQDLRGTQREL